MAALRTHQSFFEYPVTRPYPYRWFTPVTLVGVVISLVVFSIINVASTGYILNVEYTSDPNTTSQQTWFEHWPSIGGGKVQASCQASVADVSSQFLTNNSALTYEITEVTKHTPTGDKISLPALIYNNNPLQNCRLLSITILLDWATGGRTAAQIAWSAWEAVLEGRVVCDVANGEDDGLTTVNITAFYNLVPDTVSIYTGDFKFTGRNATTQASLYWAESLLAGYWYQLTVQLYRENYANFISVNKDAYTSGFLYLVPNKSITDIKNLSYFNLLNRWITLQEYNQDTSTYGKDSDTAATLLQGRIIPNIWIEADTMAKVFYSTIMTDLGQVHAEQNILVDKNLLTYFTANLSKTVTSAGQKWGPMTVQYNASNSTIGPLGTQPSILTMDYLCQIPGLKDTGNLLVSLIVADLVFVQALWFLFKQTTIFFLKRKQPSTNYCAACAQTMPMEGDNSSQVPLRNLQVPTAYESLRDQDSTYSTVDYVPTSIPPSKFRMNFRDDGWQRLEP